MRALIDPTKKAFEKRELCIRHLDDELALLCVDFSDTLQKIDIEKRTDMPIDEATKSYPYRFKIDNKSLDPVERAKKGLEPFDFSNEDKVIRALGEKYTFDMPLWFLRKANDSITKILEYDRPLIFQSKGCNLHDWTTSGGCVYCYVDDKSNNPSISKNGVWITAENILDTAERLRANSSIRNNRELHRIRHSGGEPTIELDFTLNIMEEIEKRGLEKLYLQIDTNLSTGKFIRQMILEKEYPEDILGQLSAHGVTVYAAFKGTSDENIQYNTQAKLTVDDQLDSFELLLDSGLEVFPCIYNPDYRALPNFLDKLKNISEPSVKRLRVEPINWSYGPTACRMEELAKLNKIAPEKELENYRKIEEENFEKSEVIMRGYLDKFGLKYKEFDRTKIEL